MQQIQWNTISDEQFQSLCISLLYREGYRNITPLGSRGVKEEGRDAVDETLIGESVYKKVIVFQFKRWTSNYSDAEIKRLVKKELDEKIIPSGRKIDEYKLVTCYSLAKLNKWFTDKLPKEYPFPISYFEKTWLENRLTSDNQDLRRDYFGIEIEKHSPKSLVETCKKLTEQAVRSVGVKYIPDLYVERSIEDQIQDFLKSDKPCFVIVDRSGRGKTNLLCHLAEKLFNSTPVVLIFGAQTITAEYSLIAHITRELGYTSPSGSSLQSGLWDVDRVSKQANFTTLILVDGISENNDVVEMKKALRELLMRYGDTKNLKFIFTCRDTLWSRFQMEFPDQYVYQTKIQELLSKHDNSKQIGAYLGDWTDTELDIAIKLYSNYFNVNFDLSNNARNHCKYPLLFRLFCETHNNMNIGFIDALPLQKVFEGYLETKVQKLADYFGISFSPEHVNTGILKLREKMWLDGDRNSLDLGQVEITLVDLGFSPPDAIVTRMCDEGVLLKMTIDRADSIKFAFDEIGDYLLFLVISNQYLNNYSTDIEQYLRRL